MDPASPIYVAGHAGLLGSALVRALRREGHTDVLTASRDELDLTDQRAVRAFFQRSRPRYVLLAAARVGGIHRNRTCPAEMIQTNLAIQCNVIDAARLAGVQRLLFVGSACSYPRECEMPLRTDALLTGPLEPTNEPFAVAKIAGIKTCQACNRQYGTDFVSVIPATLYGPGDHFDADGHVVAALMARYHQAKVQHQPSVAVWGTGNPRREFLYVDDAAEAMLLLMRSEKLAADLYNVGTGGDVAISELSGMIAAAVGYGGQTVFDTDKPDGMPRRCLDSSAIRELGFRPRVDLAEGLAQTYRWFCEQQAHSTRV